MDYPNERFMNPIVTLEGCPSNPYIVSRARAHIK